MDTKTVNRVSGVNMIINAALSAFKLAVGVFAHSQALISDGVESTADIISTAAIMIGINMSSKESDKEHPYGHERIECVFSLMLAAILFITGLGIGLTGIKTVIFNKEIVVSGKAALAAAFATIIIKEAMYQFTARTAKKINSSAMAADARHQRSDALSSIGTLIGVGGAILGFPILDPIASVVICVFIIKTAYEVFKDAVNRLIDSACDDEWEGEIRRVILSVDGVCGIDSMRTRKFGSKVYVDVEIAEDGELSLSDAHKIAENVHDKTESMFSDVKHCMVHVNPVSIRA